jgi:hypothetical protein
MNNVTNKKDSNFRLNSRKLFLTYSHTTLEKEDVLTQLKTILGSDIIKNFIIAKEKHTDENNFHIHVYLELYKKIDIINCNKLDLIESTVTSVNPEKEKERETEKRVHGHYTTINVRYPVKLQEYVKKGGDYISSNNLITNDEFDTEIYKIAQSKGIEEAMEYFCRIRPHEVIRRYKSIYSNLQKFLSTVPKITKPHYSITDYTYPSEIRDWFEKETHEQTLVVVGKSGYGKTEGMIALLQPFNPILIKHLEQSILSRARF